MTWQGKIEFAEVRRVSGGQEAPAAWAVGLPGDEMTELREITEHKHEVGDSVGCLVIVAILAFVFGCAVIATGLKAIAKAL